MNDMIVQTDNLYFSFKAGQPILNGINMKVPKGSIYGFLGPNGAGKTTTLRLLLGLLSNQKGEIKIFDQHLAHHRIDILKRLGSLVEQPSLYLHLTGYENLEIYRLIYGCKKQRINEVLEIVGLTTALNKKAKQYSLGMKQRLAIAIALLPQPEFLILDEPTNGLDPNGIIETRELIKRLNKEFGTTVLVSSHILAEVEKMATHVGIIHKGNMLFQGTLKELQLMQSSKSALEIETNDNNRAATLLNDITELTQTDTAIIIPFKNKNQSAAINRKLVESGLEVYALHPQHNDLEQLFMDITSNGK
ncbi:MAG: ABC transporter ATP-binding protein [Sphingobacteriales bacterium]|nr:ABC transporter ATP-binding protein [Sphingobacteriales bacterium]MBI3719314.1 ABC transporter ATP-binding protein [Sphingobacteriales bacterium]